MNNQKTAGNLLASLVLAATAVFATAAGALEFKQGDSTLSIHPLPFGDAVSRVIVDVESDTGVRLGLEALVTLNRVSVTAFTPEGFVTLTESCGAMTQDAGTARIDSIDFWAPDLQRWGGLKSSAGLAGEIRTACGLCTTGAKSACQACAGAVVNAFTAPRTCGIATEGDGSGNGHANGGTGKVAGACGGSYAGIRLGTHGDGSGNGHANGGTGNAVFSTMGDGSGNGHANGGTGNAVFNTMGDGSGNGHANGGTGNNVFDTMGDGSGNGHANGGTGNAVYSAMGDGSGNGHANGGTGNAVYNPAGDGSGNGHANGGTGNSIWAPAGDGSGNGHANGGTGNSVVYSADYCTAGTHGDGSGNGHANGGTSGG